MVNLNFQKISGYRGSKIVWYTHDIFPEFTKSTHEEFHAKVVKLRTQPSMTRRIICTGVLCSKIWSSWSFRTYSITELWCSTNKAQNWREFSRFFVLFWYWDLEIFVIALKIFRDMISVRNSDRFWTSPPPTPLDWKTRKKFWETQEE